MDVDHSDLWQFLVAKSLPQTSGATMGSAVGLNPHRDIIDHSSRIIGQVLAAVRAMSSREAYTIESACQTEDDRGERSEASLHFCRLCELL